MLFSLEDFCITVFSLCCYVWFEVGRKQNKWKMRRQAAVCSRVGQMFEADFDNSLLMSIYHICAPSNSLTDILLFHF